MNKWNREDNMKELKILEDPKVPEDVKEQCNQ